MKIQKIASKVLRWLMALIALFFATSIIAVLLYKFIPVYVTPLMVIRSVENTIDHRDVRTHHQWVPLNKISSDLPLAVMSSEDQHFLEHWGFDIEAIEEAAKYNATHKKKHGASTISQQTAKNVFLWPGRSWVRKGFEAYFTLLIELVWGKERIMEVYLNSIEMGDGIYGAEAVAEYNFNKKAKDLTAADCALIAATLPNPRKFSSKNPSSYMKKRQRQILPAMQYFRRKKTPFVK